LSIVEINNKSGKLGMVVGQIGAGHSVDEVLAD